MYTCIAMNAALMMSAIYLQTGINLMEIYSIQGQPTILTVNCFMVGYLFTYNTCVHKCMCGRACVPVCVHARLQETLCDTLGM